MKNQFSSLGIKIERAQAKTIVGGAGTCCAHNSDWGYSSCGLDAQTAQSRATEYALTSGQSGYWCCSHCPQT